MLVLNILCCVGFTGFCLLNNVAVAAAVARSQGVERVLIVDWDVSAQHSTLTPSSYIAQCSYMHSCRS
jgi:Histone deacetylase domain